VAFATVKLPDGKSFNLLIALTSRAFTSGEFFFVDAIEVASSIPIPGVLTVPPGAETAQQPQIGLGPAPGELLAAYLTATFVYTWNGSAVVTQSKTF
jgi:hypothetical protein